MMLQLSNIHKSIWFQLIDLWRQNVQANYYIRKHLTLTAINQKIGHLPKHLITEEVRAEVRNVIPADPPGKYDIA